MLQDYLEIQTIDDLNDIVNYSYQNNPHIIRENINMTSETIKFIKVRFGNISLEKDRNVSLFFENCKGDSLQLNCFDSTFTDNCEFNEINATLKESSFPRKVSISDSKITKFHATGENIIERCEIETLLAESVDTSSIYYTKKIQFNEGRNIIGELTVKRLPFELLGTNSTSINKIEIENVYNELICFQNLTVKQIEIKNINISDNKIKLEIDSVEKLETIKIYDSKLISVNISNCIMQELLIDNNFPCQKFTIKDCFIKEYFLHNYDINKLYIDGKTNIVHFVWNLSTGKIKNIQCRHGEMSDFPIIGCLLCFDGTITSDSEINFLNYAIESILFWNVSVQGKLIFSNVLSGGLIASMNYRDIFERLDINLSIKNYQQRKMFPKSFDWSWGEIPKYSFFIINSDLGKAIFYNCGFTKMDLYMSGAKINEINISDSYLPKKLYKPDRAPSNSSIQYAQLRKIHESVGDTIKANMYQAEELNAHYLSLRWWKREHLSEKFNLWLNGATNYYGQNYVKAFCVTIIWSSIFYTFYCLLLGFRLDLSSPSSWNIFWEIFLNFFEFLNPIHKADYIADALLGLEKPKDIPSSARGWEVISRILNGYFIYQFVQAFRKYGKR